MAIIDLIGSSPKFRALLAEVERVAPVDSAVLIQGETGTGKEVIARSIHETSPRRNHRFVALNCAAIPSALLESELFGHERGAFTGACTQTRGRTLNLIGSSSKFRALLRDVETVAPVDSAVLIQGETGTGKEVIARAIHEASPRRNHRFVALNCAAIPSALLESELFGHERGAFTGACTQTKGRFQMADGGTLFLDEIGDMPLELQPKLLRALQEQEFERLGSTQAVRVNVRVVAATNQDLGELMTKKLFRADLFYRLNVIPICLPPLRERVQDILPLTEFFVAKFAARLNKPIDSIPDEVMAVLQAHDWPGNIRELQNFIERAVLYSPGSVLRLPLDLKQTVKQCSESGARTLADADREHILETLEHTDWTIGGQDGAAKRLGLPRTTLIYKMRKLGIETRRTLAALPIRQLADEQGYAAANC